MAFTYPRSQHVRRYGPRGYRAYQSYEPWLRESSIFVVYTASGGSDGVLTGTRCLASIISGRTSGTAPARGAPRPGRPRDARPMRPGTGGARTAPSGESPRGASGETIILRPWSLTCR